MVKLIRTLLLGASLIGLLNLSPCNVRAEEECFDPQSAPVNTLLWDKCIVSYKPGSTELYMAWLSTDYKKQHVFRYFGPGGEDIDKVDITNCLRVRVPTVTSTMLF